MPSFPNTDRQIVAAVYTNLGTSYAVAAGLDAAQYYSLGKVKPLILRAEATFAATGGVTSVTFKVQVARGTTGYGTATSPLWTDLALYNAAAPGTAPATEWTINETAGATIGLDLYSTDQHLGRNYFRTLIKAAGTAADGDLLNVYAPK